MAMLDLYLDRCRMMVLEEDGEPVCEVCLLELPDGRTEGYLFREIEFVIEGKRTARTDGTGCVLKK